MHALAAFVRAVDALNDAVGRVVSWLIFGCVLVAAATALLRYLFSIGYVWTQDLYVAEFAVAFMLAAGYTYLTDQHVRVDIFRNNWSPRAKAIAEIVGICVFLLPWLAVLAWTSIPFISLSWRILEPSPQAGGLPGYFLLKSVILAFCVLLALQGLATLGRNVLFLNGRAGLLPERTPASGA